MGQVLLKLNSRNKQKLAGAHPRASHRCQLSQHSVALSKEEQQLQNGSSENPEPHHSHSRALATCESLLTS